MKGLGLKTGEEFVVVGLLAPAWIRTHCPSVARPDGYQDSSTVPVLPEENVMQNTF